MPKVFGVLKTCDMASPNDEVLRDLIYEGDPRLVGRATASIIHGAARRRHLCPEGVRPQRAECVNPFET